MPTLSAPILAAGSSRRTPRCSKERREGQAVNQILQYGISSLSLGGLYALMALGLVIVYGILRLVNFAYGELVMVGGYGLLIFGNTATPWLICAVLSIIAALVAGVLMERV